jgi:hypothetical protein
MGFDGGGICNGGERNAREKGERFNAEGTEVGIPTHGDVAELLAACDDLFFAQHEAGNRDA